MKSFHINPQQAWRADESSFDHFKEVLAFHSSENTKFDDNK